MFLKSVEVPAIWATSRNGCFGETTWDSWANSKLQRSYLVSEDPDSYKDKILCGRKTRSVSFSGESLLKLKRLLLDPSVRAMTGDMLANEANLLTAEHDSYLQTFDRFTWAKLSLCKFGADITPEVRQAWSYFIDERLAYLYNDSSYVETIDTSIRVMHIQFRFKPEILFRIQIRGWTLGIPLEIQALDELRIA